ncbi:MAG: type II toxin-antitoxin system HipA family toxin [Deltaproteobacteria bacterium]|jgi:serine/threonine-protein kinase HipA|nr:type II toxin-antitoxin system HipA family toxin [Deltaproteobacteria bacterium]
MASELVVWFERKLVGYISRSGLKYIVFKYAPDWLESEDSFPISLSLPFQREFFSKEVSSSFFDNLLPEEEVRKQVADNKRLSTDDIFGLLQAIGADCAGALSILLPGQESRHNKHTYQPLSASDLPAFLAEQRINPLGTGDKYARLSLAGAQSKTSIFLSGDSPQRYARPCDGAPGTHIVKPVSLSFPNLAENELFCMLLAQAFGLDTPEAGLTPTLERAFLIRRYDRRQTPDGIRRIHQEDFCQALGVPRAKKYQNHGGPSYQQCFTVLDNCHEPEEERLKLFRWAVFNYLIGNADAHAKNISLLYDDPPKPRLAPFYDLVCTTVYPLNKNMAMKIGRKGNPDHVYGSDWDKLIAHAKISLGDGRHILQEMGTLPSFLLDGARDDFLFMYGQVPVIHQIVTIINERAGLVLSALDEIYS